MKYTYDGSQEICPLPLVKLRVILKKMLKGDTCSIRIADKGSKQDIPKLLVNQGYSFTQVNVEQNIIELNIQL